MQLTKHFSEIRDKEKEILSGVRFTKRRLIIKRRRKLFKQPYIDLPLEEPSIDCTSNNEDPEYAM